MPPAEEGYDWKWSDYTGKWRRCPVGKGGNVDRKAIAQQMRQRQEGVLNVGEQAAKGILESKMMHEETLKIN